MDVQIVHAPNGWCRLRVADSGLQQVVGSQAQERLGSRLGEVLFRPSAPRRKTRWPFRNAGIRCRDARASRPHGLGEDEPLGGASPVSRPDKLPVPGLTSGFSYTARTSSIFAGYIPRSRSATHHIFFPPRLQVVAFQENPDRFPTHPRHQFAFHRFLGQQAHRPTSSALRRWTTGQRYDALPLLTHPARPLPAVAARTRPAPGRLADSVGWSATRSLGLTPRSSLLGGWVAPRPVAAGPKPAEPSARAANHSATSAATPAVPAWTGAPNPRSLTFMSQL